MTLIRISKNIVFALALLVISCGSDQSDNIQNGEEMSTYAKQVDFLNVPQYDPTTNARYTDGYVKVLLAGTSTLATIYSARDKSGTYTNPVQLDSDATKEMFLDGVFDFELYEGDPSDGGVKRDTLYGMDYRAIFGDGVETFADLQALTGTDGEVIELLGYTTVGDGGGGRFYWSDSDLSAYVTIDTEGGVYVAPTGEDGSNGAWVRIVGNYYDVRWFGAATSATDNFDAFEGASTLVNYLGGGRIYVPSGDWATKNAIFVRSGVTFFGDGYESHVHNTADDGTLAEVTFMLGNYKASGQADNIYAVNSYAMDAATEGATTVTLSTAADDSNFSVGGVVFLFSSEATTWRKYQQINKVTAINSGVLTLKYPVYKDTTGLTMVVGVDGTGSLTDYYGRTQQACISGGIRDLSVTSEGYRWIAGGASIDSVIENVTVRKSETLMAMNGFAHGRAVVNGNFSIHGVNCAYFSHDSYVEVNGAAWNGASVTANSYGLLIEENAHDMRYMVDMDMGIQTGNPIRIAKAAENNTVLPGSKFRQHDTTGSTPNIYAQFTAASGSSAAAPKGGNVIDGVYFDRTGSDAYFFSANDDYLTEEQTPPNIVRNCTNYMPDVSAVRAFDLGTSSWHFYNNYSTQFGVTATTTATDLVIDGLTIDTDTYTITDPDSVVLIKNVITPTSYVLKTADVWDYDHSVTSSTDDENVIATTTIPQGKLKPGDRINVRATGRGNASTDNVHLEVWAMGTKVAGFSGTVDGGISIVGGALVKTNIITKWVFQILGPSTATTSYVLDTTDIDANDMVIQFRAYVTNAADSIVPYDTLVKIDRQYS